ncbi:histidinol-phosphatase [Anoxybacillus rupiensis]|uniref:Histidinol-phosphatase n=1 Tax=Anoxybacteroides rupiense TaxID=311460 RepID=A0ABT5VZA8_9BACL|nr:MULTISPECIES: histidinol-phosphatase [Anoxybacillus]MDE8562413.1 histidinol-phosphatase [Anoxybacillus rupiensis]QHC04598.1 histidinol-phosphatase HisJ family protein [Anoxybacillus sp. PDR2]
MLTDYHNHLERGTLTLDYLKQFTDEAKRKGIQHFGISEHAYHFYQTKNILSNPWVEERRYYDMADYVRLFHEAWDAGIDVKMSIEMDYTPGKHAEMAAFIQAYDFDYVIGSIHWIDDFGIDLAEYRKEWERRDLYDTYRKYFDQVVTLAESNLFDVIGHLDLVKIFNYVPKDEEFLLEQYDRATTALANSKTCVEISTAGLRKPVGELYPDRRLLQMCYDKRIPIVLSSDAHVPEHVGADFDQAIALAREVGYTELITFHKGERQAVPLG